MQRLHSQEMMRSYYTHVTPGPRLLIPSFLCEIANSHGFGKGGVEAVDWVLPTRDLRNHDYSGQVGTMSFRNL